MALGVLCAGAVLLFDLQLHADGWQTVVSSRVVFTSQQFAQFLWYSINAGIALGAITLAAALATALYRALTAP